MFSVFDGICDTPGRVAVDILLLLEEEARKRQEEHKRDGDYGRQRGGKIAPPTDRGSARDNAATATHVNHF